MQSPECHSSFPLIILLSLDSKACRCQSNIHPVLQKREVPQFDYFPQLYFGQTHFALWNTVLLQSPLTLAWKVPFPCCLRKTGKQKCILHRSVEVWRTFLWIFSGRDVARLHLCHQRHLVTHFVSKEILHFKENLRETEMEQKNQKKVWVLSARFLEKRKLKPHFISSTHWRWNIFRQTPVFNFTQKQKWRTSYKNFEHERPKDVQPPCVDGGSFIPL